MRYEYARMNGLEGLLDLLDEENDHSTGHDGDDSNREHEEVAASGHHNRRNDNRGDDLAKSVGKVQNAEVLAGSSGLGSTSTFSA